MIVIKDIEELRKLRLEIQKELQIDLILQSLTSSYSQFIINFYINKLYCTIPKLVNMLVTTKRTLKSSMGTVLAVEQTSFKRKFTKKRKAKSAKKQKKDNRPKKKFLRRSKQRKNIFTVMLKATGGETIQNT